MLGCLGGCNVQCFVAVLAELPPLEFDESPEENLPPGFLLNLPPGLELNWVFLTMIAARSSEGSATAVAAARAALMLSPRAVRRRSSTRFFWATTRAGCGTSPNAKKATVSVLYCVLKNF